MLIYLVIAFVFISTFLLGKVLEKFRVPWIFAALILGSALAIYNPVSMVTDSEVFSFLAQLGMYFLLFLVGLELDVKELKDKGAFIFKSTFFIIFFEGIVGSIFVHFVFNYSWVISLLISLSFATVGEAILIPILDEFNLVNTTLGQAIIGIGTLDDLIEIFTLVASSFIVGAKAESNLTPVVISLVLMIVLTFFLTRMKKESEKFKFLQIESLFIFVLFVFFLFIGVGSFAEAAPLGALFAGISLRTFLPEERLSFIESEIKSLTYGFFGPLFFLWVGLELDISYLASAPLLIILTVAIAKGSKLLSSYLVGRKLLGTRGSILLGIGLSVRFSTSIIIIKFLYDNHVIGYDIFSIIVASSIIFKFIVPVLFSQLAVRWGFGSDSHKNTVPVM